MTLPFTVDQFLAVFAAYNRMFWPITVLLWTYAAAGAVVLARPRSSGRFITMMLTVQWGWAALGYHAAFFSTINPAAWLFAALFAIQSALFCRAAVAGDLHFSSTGSWRHAAGWTLVAYSLLYPAIVRAEGHVFPEAPTFGVPCPTTLLTIGLLLAADPPWPRALAVIPVVWALIAGSAAVLLGVRADVMLWVAGGTLAGHVLSLSFRSNREQPELHT
jgi:hypothetical protein